MLLMRRFWLISRTGFLPIVKFSYRQTVGVQIGLKSSNSILELKLWIVLVSAGTPSESQELSNSEVWRVVVLNFCSLISMGKLKFWIIFSQRRTWRFGKFSHSVWYYFNVEDLDNSEAGLDAFLGLTVVIITRWVWFGVLCIIPEDKCWLISLRLQWLRVELPPKKSISLMGWHWLVWI